MILHIAKLIFIWLRRGPTPASVSGSFVPPKKISYFLCLETKKVSKENSRLQIILGLIF